MLVEKRNFKNAEDFSRACMSRFIDHLQRKGLNEAEVKKLRKIYIGNVADMLGKKAKK